MKNCYVTINLLLHNKCITKWPSGEGVFFNTSTFSLLLLLFLLISKREDPGLSNVKVAQSLSDYFFHYWFCKPFIKLNESKGLLRPRWSYQGIQKKKRRWSRSTNGAWTTCRREMGWVIIYPHLKTMAILKIVQTFILMTVSKSCSFNKDQRTVGTKQKKILSLYFCLVITVHRKWYPVSRIIAVPPPPIIDNCRLCFQEKEKILRFGFDFFWFCFVSFCFL